MRKDLGEREIDVLPEDTVGQRIKKLRLSAALSQEKLSEELGFSANYFGQVERGAKALSKNMADALCARFDVSYSYLYQGIRPEQLREDPVCDTSRNHIIEFFASCSDEECELLYRFLKMIVQDHRRREIGLYMLQMEMKKRPGRPKKCREEE